MWTRIPAKSVKHIIAATFPNYRKREVAIDCSGSVTFHDLNWSGGTRAQYKSCSLDGRTGNSLAKYNQMAPWDPRQIEGQTIPIPQGLAVVSAGDFCGKPATMVIHIHPADMPKLLPAS